MKINKIIVTFAMIFMLLNIVGCNKFLDKEPYDISPIAFFNTAEHLNAFAIARYNMFPTSGWDIGPAGHGDDDTDNQMSAHPEDYFLPGEYRVYATDGSSWNWEDIYNTNYFFDQVLPKREAGEISGEASLIDHYIGEMYFFRAYAYFEKLRDFGDVPIILEVLPDNKEYLIESTIRQPRHKVARQIISDLHLAIKLLKELPSEGTNRISKNVARLFKSRVALYEASWERNFKGTAFVPNGDGWPGKKDHPNLDYNADTEIAFFLNEVLDDNTKIVADITLTENPDGYDYINDGNKPGLNKYYEMFGTVGSGLKNYSEVLLFRAFNKSLGQINHQVHYLRFGASTGYTHQYMQNFLMANGLPIYADGSGYNIDDSEIKNMKVGRDSRFKLFVQAPEEVLSVGDSGAESLRKTTTVPYILFNIDEISPTGYCIKKGACYDPNQWIASAGEVGRIYFRSVEAKLNYIEAYYLKNGNISGDADLYWRDIRNRANVDPNYEKTVAATIMKEEAKNDLAAYTAGVLISKLEYSIRRERRSEFIAEGYRRDDLMRYRALDQLISKRVFMPQGFNLWDFYANSTDPHFYDDKAKKTLLIPFPNSGSNVSENKEFTINGNEVMEKQYYYPSRAIVNNEFFNGYKWAAAHYLQPIAAEHLMNASPSSESGVVEVENSVIYQNPGWGNIAGESAQQVPGFN